ncbi:hypothetical protein BT96DRAFT_994566 [Gymnopus androsaceus JB14]|uniref:Uncharacterized protein n=1 Tax=Gymnopus androsaceus JB14 TaxID=1447944 RepID=A0A6A4HJM7_9AGAR|nr:hypothetical protein BT96DRAFT_994566 [Gymnopus androsaceus JB14]
MLALRQYTPDAVIVSSVRVKRVLTGAGQITAMLISLMALYSCVLTISTYSYALELSDSTLDTLLPSIESMKDKVVHSDKRSAKFTVRETWICLPSQMDIGVFTGYPEIFVTTAIPVFNIPLYQTSLVPGERLSPLPLSMWYLQSSSFPLYGVGQTCVLTGADDKLHLQLSHKDDLAKRLQPLGQES